MEVTSKVVDSFQGKLRICCKLISLVLYAFSAVSLVSMLLRITQSISQPSDPALSVPLFLELCSTAALIAASFITAHIFHSPVQSRSVFTKTQSNRTLFVGMLLLCSCALDIASQISLSAAIEHGLTTGVDLLSGAPHINGEKFIASLICLGLGLLFRYAALLQSVSDETV